MSVHNPWHQPAPDRPWPGPVRAVHTQQVGLDTNGRGIPLSPGYGGAFAGSVTKPRRSNTLRVLAWIAVALVFSLCGLIALAVILTNTSLIGVALGAVAAALPMALVVASLHWLDRYENEPRSMRALAFGWGATVGVFVALFLNTTADKMIMLAGGNPDATAVVVAPVVEEAVKAGGVILVLLVMRHRFDGIVDGVVYAGFSAVAFAFVENILYFGRAYEEAGAEGFLWTFVFRGVLSPFAHPMFTAMTGIGIGVAVSTNNKVVRVLAPLTGLMTAIVLHGLWNFSATSNNLWVYPLLMLPIFGALVTFVILARRREGRLIRTHLTTYCRYGWLTPADVTMLASLQNRRSARAWALRTQGSEGKAAMERYQDVASDLAFLRERIEHGTARPQAKAMEPTLLNTMWQLRARFVH